MRDFRTLNAPLGALVLAAALAAASSSPGSALHGRITGQPVLTGLSSLAGRPPLTGGSLGVPEVMQDWGRGDTWYNTWASDGNIYATSDDTQGFTSACNSNLAVNELTGGDPSGLSSPFVNCMTSYGSMGSQGDYQDGRTWKNDGIISVDGTLYLAVTRQQNARGGYPDGFQPSDDASIVKSTDLGRTWSNSFGTTNSAGGAAPPFNPGTGQADAMFPGTSFGTPEFINYGEDDNPAGTADQGGTYVYAISNDGFAYDGSKMILGRVLRSQIGNLNASNWQFYTGPPGGDGTNAADWSSRASAAVPILTAKHHLSQSGVQYIPGLGVYVMTSFYYPFVKSWENAGDAKEGAASETTWDFYQAPHPWGPWTRFFNAPTTECYITCGTSATSQLGLYDPALVSKFIAMNGRSNVIFCSGDFNAPFRPNDYLGHLHAYPFTLDTSAFRVVDDSTAVPPGAGSWGASFEVGGFYDDTDHVSDTPGTSVSYRFTGDSIMWVGSKNDNHGIARVSIDGKPPTMVDTYAASWEKQQVLYTDSSLSQGSHTITITVTSRHKSASTGLYQDLDAFIVGQATGATRSP
jgi:Carbohydrate esterase 2 N-terminal